MRRVDQALPMQGLYGITALILSFGPFITASGEIVTGTITSTTANISSGQQFTTNAMDNLCDPTLNPIACGFSAGMSGRQAQNLSPQAGIQAETIAITSPYQFIRSINQRMGRLIAGGPTNNVRIVNQQRSFMLRTSTTPAGLSTGAYGFVGPFGVSISGGGGFGNRHTAQDQTGFKLDTRQANLMIDYSFNQKLIGGFSFGYLGTDRNMKLGAGGLNSDSYRFAPFLLYRPTANSYLNMMGGYALVNYNSTRSALQFTNAKAKYDANQFFVSLGGGYTVNLKDGWSLRGYGRGDYSYTDIESFQERGGLTTNLGNSNSFTNRVNGQNIHSVTSTVGAELSHAISTRTLAAVIIPSLRAEWVHEFENDRRTIGVGLVSENGASISQITIAGPQRNWANLGFGLQMIFPRSIVGYVNYQRLIIKHANDNIILGGIRINL